MRRFYEGQRTLVTGGLGFIGSNLAMRLLDLGAHVLVVDSLIPETGANLFNLEPVQDHPRLSVRTVDVRDVLAMQRLVRGQSVIFNLAGQVSHIDSMQDPYTDLEINCRSQLAMLEACRHNAPEAKVVFASTRQIYGRVPEEQLPVDERQPPNPVDVNGINKLAGERYHVLYNNVYGIHASVLRLTNTYGPRMQINDGRVIPNFMWQALRGENLTVYGDGSQTRSFCYVSDEVDGILRLARSAEHEPVNVGNPTEFTILECARKVIATTGSASQIKFEALPQDDPKQRCPDISKAKRVLGWEPKVELESGLKLSLEYFRRAVAKKEQLA